MGFIEDILGFLTGAGGSAAMGAVNDIGQGIAATGANIRNEITYGQGAAELSNLRDVSQTNMETMQRDVLTGYDRNRESPELRHAAAAFNTGQTNIEQSMVGQSAGLRDTINRGFRNRGTRAMGIIDRTGEQERKNLNQDFRSFENAAAQDTTSRGLSGTTVQSGVRRGVQRERGRAMGNLEERIRQQKIDTFLGTSADTLSAAESMGRGHIDRQTGLAQNRVSGAFDMAAQQYNQGQNRLGAYLGAQERLGTNIEASRQGLTANVVNWMGDRNDIGPSEALFRQDQAGLGAGTVQPPKAPRDTSILGGVIPAAAAVGGQVVAATIMAGGVCVDADAIIMCEGGDKKLRDVRAGDVVIGSFGDRRVVFADLCPPHDDRPFDYLEVRMFSGKTLRATRDHLVGGIPMGRLKPGHVIEDDQVVEVIVVEPCECGDLLLESDLGRPAFYYANGIMVASMLNDHGYTLEQMNARKAAYEARSVGV